MAEAYLKHFGGDMFEAESAGLEPGTLNPLAVEVMREDGIDISNNPTNDVFEFFKQGKRFHYVITVCDAGSSGAMSYLSGNDKEDCLGFSGPLSFYRNE